MKKKKKNSSRKTPVQVVRVIIILIIILTVGGLGLWTVLSANDDLPMPNTGELIPAEQLALSGVTSNAEWQPHITERNFGGYSMVLVPAGSFVMGSTEDEIDLVSSLCEQGGMGIPAWYECKNWFSDENPTQIMAFDEPFWIDQTEVTRAMYFACIEVGACTETPDSSRSTEPDRPISQVTWSQAIEFCAWRSARLPSEAEWEYAARGPDHLIFPWGNIADGTEANHADRNYEEMWGAEDLFSDPDHDDGFTELAPVGSYPQGVSWVGAVDMAGNVYEWTATLFPEPALSTYDERRVIRGGSYAEILSLSRTAYQGAVEPSFYSYTLGFRCVRAWG